MNEEERRQVMTKLVIAGLILFALFMMGGSSYSGDDD